MHRDLNEEFNVNVLNLPRKKEFFSMTTGIASEKAYPAKKKFYNTLINNKISDKKYEHVLNVWVAFKINTLKDHHDLYLKVHVIKSSYHLFKCMKLIGKSL